MANTRFMKMNNINSSLYMNRQLSTFAKIISSAIILASFSCKKTESSNNLILESKNNFESYQVHEEFKKIDKDGSNECEKFITFDRNDKGFEMYGADIADIFSVFTNKNRNDIILKNENNSFYSIVYKGKNHDSISKIILNKILDLKALKIDTIRAKNNMYAVENIDYQKINQFSNLIKDAEIKSYISNNLYKVENANISVLLTTLNDIFPKTFATNYKQDDSKRYNFEFPLGKDKTDIINLFKDKYGVTFILTESEYANYIIEKK